MEKYRLVGERKSGLLPSSDDGRLNVNANVDATIASGGEATTIAASGVGGGGVGGSSSEVRITQQGKPRNYISYAMTLLVSTKPLPFCCTIPTGTFRTTLYSFWILIVLIGTHHHIIIIHTE